ncbi:DUF732 domain-containing protein [Micrococcus luteus]|uniref:DUF732 domain-containing protein n=1 Tax=Micrococcus luteus TaxID=1270 RepID=UPI003423535E
MNAQPAQATPLSYLQALNNRGLTVYDTQAMMTTGLAVCAALNTADGNQVARAVYANYTDVSTLFQAQMIVLSAVEELCPEHDHRGAYAA